MILSDVDGNAVTEQKDSGSRFLLDGGAKPFSQHELNDLVRDLGVSIDSAELLGSRLNDLVVILEKLGYTNHGWVICGDFKVISTIFGYS